MAQSGPLATSSPMLQELQKALRTPEPMWLVVISVAGDGAYSDTAEDRVRQNLRAYDQLWRIDDTTFAMTLKTMADSDSMESRMDYVFLLLAEPYAVGDDFVQVRIQMGATVRKPQDTATALLSRVGAALVEAEANDCICLLYTSDAADD